MNEINCNLEKIIDLEPYLSDKKLLNKFRSINLNIVLGESYCTEANIFNKLSKDIVVFGPGDSGMAHKANEYIEVSKIAEYEKIIKSIIKNDLPYIFKS